MSGKDIWPAPVAFARPQPGDFCCVPISGAVGVSIEVGQWLDAVVSGWPRLAVRRLQPYDHAEVYVGEPDAAGPCGYTIGAYPGGAARRALRCPPEQLPGSLWSSGLIDLTPVQRTGIVAWATEHLETPYSFLDYGAIAAHGLHLPVPGLRRYIASSGHLICSQFVDMAYSANGEHLFTDGRWPGYVDPLDLASLLQSMSIAAVDRGMTQL